MSFMATRLSSEDNGQIKAKQKLAINIKENKETDETKLKRSQEEAVLFKENHTRYVNEQLKKLESVNVYLERTVHVQAFNQKMGFNQTKGPRLAGGVNKFSDYTFRVITLEKLKKEVANNNSITIDLNGYENFTNGHIPNAINGFANNLETKLPKDKKTLIAVYFPLKNCDAWNKVADIHQLGYNNIAYLIDGLYAWVNDGGALEKSPKEKFSEGDSGLVIYKNKLKNIDIAISVSDTLIVKSNCEEFAGISLKWFNNSPQVISKEQLKKAISEKDATLIDLSGYENYLKGHIPSALNGYENNIISKLPTIKNSLIIFYFPPEDLNGWSKLQEIDSLIHDKRLGFSYDIKFFTGGIPEWLENGGQLEK